VFRKKTHLREAELPKEKKTIRKRDWKRVWSGKRYGINFQRTIVAAQKLPGNAFMLTGGKMAMGKS